MKKTADKKGGNGDIYFDNENNTATKYLRNTSSLEKIQRFRQELDVLNELNLNNIPNIVEVLAVNIDEKDISKSYKKKRKYDGSLEDLLPITRGNVELSLKLILPIIKTLKILSELSFREIAGILNMPIGTVQWKYYKALHTLKILIGNLSMFIVAITVFIANKTVFKNRKKVVNEEVKQEEQEEYRKDEESTSKDNDNSQESTNKETEDIKENLKLENEMLGDNATNNEVKEQINVEEISNLNKIDIGILSVSGIFLTITIIFSIIFVKHQQNRKKKVSK